VLGPDHGGSDPDGAGRDRPGGDPLGLDGLGLDEPDVETPDTSAERLFDKEVPKRLRREFVLQAAGLNLGVLSTTTGTLVLGFTEGFRAGVGLILVGIVLLAITAWRYVHHAPS